MNKSSHPKGKAGLEPSTTLRLQDALPPPQQHKSFKIKVANIPATESLKKFLSDMFTPSTWNTEDTPWTVTTTLLLICLFFTFFICLVICWFKMSECLKRRRQERRNLKHRVEMEEEKNRRHHSRSPNSPHSMVDMPPLGGRQIPTIGINLPPVNDNLSHHPTSNTLQVPGAFQDNFQHMSQNMSVENVTQPLLGQPIATSASPVNHNIGLPVTEGNLSQPNRAYHSQTTQLMVMPTSSAAPHLQQNSHQISPNSFLPQADPSGGHTITVGRAEDNDDGGFYQPGYAVGRSSDRTYLNRHY